MECQRMKTAREQIIDLSVDFLVALHFAHTLENRTHDDDFEVTLRSGRYIVHKTFIDDVQNDGLESLLQTTGQFRVVAHNDDFSIAPHYIPNRGGVMGDFR